MNNKYAIKRSNWSEKVILTLVLLCTIGLFSTVQAQQTVVENPMLPSVPVRYGNYSNSVNPVPSATVITSTSHVKTPAKKSQSTKKDLNTSIVNINSASETELVALPGIGPSKARAIAQYRQQQGNFKSVDDLQKVKGIGPATLEKLRSHLTL